MPPMQLLAMESGDEDEDDEEYRFPVNDLADVEWTELMSASMRGEVFRTQAGRFSQSMWLLQQRASLYEHECLQLSAQQRAHDPKEDDVTRFRARLAQKQAQLDIDQIREALGEEKSQELRLPSAGSVQSRAMSWHQDASGYKQWVSELNKLTPLDFIQYVTVLSVSQKQESLVQFLSSLTMELHWNTAKARLWQIGEVRKQLEEEEVSLSDWKPMLFSKPFQILFHQPNQQALTEKYLEKVMNNISGRKFGVDQEIAGPGRICKDSGKLFLQKVLCSDEAISRSTFCISPCIRLFGVQNWEVALMLKVLLDAGQDSRCFSTPIGRAILSETLRRTTRGWVVDTLVDLLYILVLIEMAICLEKVQTPETWILMTFAALSIVIAFSLILKLMGGMWLFVANSSGVAVGVLKHVNLWNVIFSLTEAFSTFVGWRFVVYACSSHGTDISDSWALFKKHPAFLSCLVLVRWTQIGVSLLQVQEIGRNIVPVFYAVTRPASINFLIFLAIVVCGSFHAYLVFPIHENFGDYSNTFNAFLKIFRLEVLGDFELSELEGLGEVVDGNITHGKLAGHVDEENVSSIHQSLRFEFLVFTLVVTVVAMNVYIGLLGELYTQAVKKRNRLYNHYLASTAYRFISRSIGIRVFACGYCGHLPEPKMEGLMWFSYDKDLLVDPTASEEEWCDH